MNWKAVGRALAYRNYRLFLAGQGISLIGTWMQQVALTWLVYRLTGSEFLLGMVGFCGQIPSFFLAPLAGTLIEHWNRHRTLMVTQTLAMLQSVALVLLVWHGVIQTWQILVLSVVLGLVNAFDMPTRQAFLVHMVGRKEDLGNAIALNSSVVNVARLVGPSLAGFVIAWGGEVTCFLTNAISYAAVILALSAMRDLPPRHGRRTVPLARSLREGFRYAFGFPPIRALLLLLGWVSLAAMSLSVLMPVFADRVLEGNARTLGFLMAASGLGALVSALIHGVADNRAGTGTADGAGDGAARRGDGRVLVLAEAVALAADPAGERLRPDAANGGRQHALADNCR